MLAHTILDYKTFRQRGERFRFCGFGQCLVRFSDLVSCGFCSFFGFGVLTVWFSVFAKDDGGFWDFLSNAFYGFSGFAEGSTPSSRAKIVIPRTTSIAFYLSF